MLLLRGTTLLTRLVKCFVQHPLPAEKNVFIVETLISTDALIL